MKILNLACPWYHKGSCYKVVRNRFDLVVNGLSRNTSFTSKSMHHIFDNLLRLLSNVYPFFMPFFYVFFPFFLSFFRLCSFFYDFYTVYPLFKRLFSLFPHPFYAFDPYLKKHNFSYAFLLFSTLS